MKAKRPILLIDSLPYVCCLLAIYLGDEFEVVVRSHAADALAWLRAGNRPVAIITDFEAGDAQPYALFRFMHAVPELQNVPLVVHTADGHTPDTISRLRSMSQAFLQKGTPPEAVTLCLTELLAA